ncbi:MAG: hypothetical protein HYX90_01140 [Chloroflexi bacterium]|nr:hypothetical protein [Chloroflexota bacterium]
MTTETCRHFWKVEGQNGPTSRATCKFCGQRRTFFNSLSAAAATMPVREVKRLRMARGVRL